jgi:TonB-dependent receptor
MKRFFRLFTILFVILVFRSVQAALGQPGKGSVTGHISDTSGSLLQGAEIELQPSGITVASNQQGGYFVNNLATGTYTITVTYVGFTLFTKVLEIKAGQTTTVDVKMEVASQKDQIFVTTERASGEAEAINRERTADNIVQVLPNEVFTSLPNANVADAVGRLPGVTLERDEGEGKYIQVRSMEPRLTNATVDGVNIPSPEPGVRQIKFDSMPADLLESVEVNKTLQANMDGDGIGGSVNLVTKTASEKPTLAFAGGGGTTPILGGRTLMQTTGTVGMRFGESKKFGALFGGSYDWNGRGINDIEPVPDLATFADGTSEPWFVEQELREYRYKRSRWGFTGSADYALGEGSDIYAKFIYSDFHDFGDKWTYDLFDNTPGISTINGNGCSGTGNLTCGAGTPIFSVSSRVPVFIISSLLFGGRHLFATSWLSWDASISRSQQVKSGGDEGADFAVNNTYNTLYPSGSSCEFSPTLTKNQYIPQFTPSCTTEAFAPTNFDMTDINTSVGHSPQLNLQFAAAYGRRYHLGSHLSTIEIGGKFRDAHKFDDSYTPTYTPNGSVPLTGFLSSFTDPHYYRNNYQFGPATDWSKLIGYLNANPSAFTLTPGSIGANSANFDYVEQVSAGYVMDTLDLTNRIRIVAGLRIEGTSLDSYTYQCDPNCLATPSQQGSVSLRQQGSYIDFLPSASVRFDLGNDTNLRVVYSRALSRPDPQDIAQALLVTVAPNTAQLGNADLKAETANNYDILVEHYLKPFGMIQGGFFYKQLYNPIVETQVTKDNYTPNPNNPSYPVGTWVVSQYVNAGSGWITGVELAYLQHFTSLPGFLSGLGLAANYSHTGSQASGIPNRSDSPRLQRQAPNLFNISPTYDRGRLSIRAGFTYNQASIYAYQYTDGTPGGLNGPLGDNYFFTHFQIDLQGSYRLKYGFSLVAYGLNLNNEVFGFYNGQPKYFVQREYYEPTVAFGLRWSPTHEK